MKKNLVNSRKKLENQSYFLDEKNMYSIQKIIHPTYLFHIQRISKEVARVTLSTQHKPSDLLLKIKKFNHEGLFYLEVSQLVLDLYTALFKDFSPAIEYYSHHEFSPFFKAFIEARNKVNSLEKGHSLSYLTPEIIRKKVDLSTAKLMWKACYTAIKSIQKFFKDKSHIIATNQFDKPARQNSKSLESYLKKLVKRYKRLTVCYQNIALIDSITLASQNQKIANFEAVAVKHARRYMEPRLLPNTYDSPSHDLYLILKKSRTAHLKNIQDHHLLGSVLAGYVWKLTYNNITSWSYNLVLFFDLAAHPDMGSTTLTELCDQLWLKLCRKRHLVQQGLTSPLLQKDLPTIIEFTPIRNNESIENIVSSLTRTDYLLRVIPPDGGRIFGKGQA